MDKIEQDAIAGNLEQVPEWSLNGETLQRTFKFDDFMAAMQFVNAVAELAESLGHHPDILVRYNKVTCTLTTHDAGGLTPRDFKAATAIDAL